MEDELQLLQDKNEKLEKEVAYLLENLKLANERIDELEEENKKLKNEKEETSELIAKTAKEAMGIALGGIVERFKNDMERSEDEELKDEYRKLKEQGLTDKQIMKLSLMENYEEVEEEYGEVVAQITQAPKK